MYKKLTSILIIAIMFTTFSACSNKDTKEALKDNSKIQVVVSFNAMKEFAEAIGKDKIQVTTIIPDGTEPHDFELKAKDLEILSNSKIFAYNGLGMETWVDKALETVKNKGLVVVDSSKDANVIKNINEDEIKEHGQFDPHLWLSLKEAQGQAKNIKDALIAVDSANKDFYEKNYKDFYDKLEGLFSDYNTKFKAITNKNFVTGHAAFAYLCRDFGLKQNSVEDVFAEGEPSAKKMKELVDYCKQNNVKTIFVEDMASPKVSETLAKEVGAKTEKIHTLESKEGNKDYVETMKDNLEMIYNSLK